MEEIIIGRLNYGFTPYPSFKENLEYNSEICHSVRKKYFPIDEFVPLHYADTMEILVCTDLVGEIIIDLAHYKDIKNAVFVIPPNIIHATHIKKCDGYLFNIKIPFKILEQYMNIKNMLSYAGCDMNLIPSNNIYYEEMHAVAQRFFEDDDNIFARMKDILSVFDLIVKNYKLLALKEPRSLSNNAGSLDIKRIIKWVEDNYHKQIHIEDAALEAGYSKSYFCNQFKLITGMTFLTYLNHVRVLQAKFLMHSDISITNIAYECGFENASNFTQMFKKFTNITPREYRKLCQGKI